MVELLSPAGSKDAFLAALYSGADAIYLGGEKFGARAYASNFDEDLLIWAIDTAHIYDKKIYLTVNTLLKETELQDLVAYLTPFYEAGLDGVIVQDFGALLTMKRAFPYLELHASTQMAVTGAYGANLLKEYGVSRVVPARELSLEEIKQLKVDTGLEIESFIHGAMCYCYSGQCLYSSMIGARSGNRGRCAGPCRLPYKAFYNGKRLNSDHELYQLSLKDLCTLEKIPQLLEAGIDSFKIEGRMKSKEYVSFVTGLYHYYIDAYYENPKAFHVEQKDKDTLQNLFSRGSLESGYYFQHNGRNLVTLHKPGYQSFAKEEDKENSSYHQKNTKDEDHIKFNSALNKAKIVLDGYFYAHKGEKMIFTLVNEKGDTALCYGDVVNSSVNQPATQNDVKKALNKMGNTPYEIKSLEIDIDQDVFLPNKQLNDLRRECVFQLQQQSLNKYRRVRKEENNNLSSDNLSNLYKDRLQQTKIAESITFARTENFNKELFIRLQTYEQAKQMKVNDSFQKIAISFDCFLEATKQKEELGRIVNNWKNSGISVGLTLPAVMRKKVDSIFKTYQKQIEDIGFQFVVVNSLEAIGLMKIFFPNMPLISDHRLYVFQRETLSFMEDFSLFHHMISYELHRQEIKDLVKQGRESLHTFCMPVYGYIPVMETAGCILKTNQLCEKEKMGNANYIDRQGKSLSVIRHCEWCENTIYNAFPLSLHKEIDNLRKDGICSFALNFTVETPKQMNQVISWYTKLLKKEQTTPLVNDFTKGHFAKGVE